MPPPRSRHRRERDAYRFIEVVPGPRLSLLDGLASASGALLAGAALSLLVQLGIALLVGELVDGARYESDEVVRASLGWWALLLAVAALAFVPLRAAAGLALAATLLAEGRTSTDVPPRAVRDRVTTTNPPGALAGLAWTLLAFAVVAGGLVAPFAMDADDAERAPTVAVSVVVGAGSAVGLVLLRPLRERWAGSQRVVRTTWGPNEVRFAEVAERRRRTALGPGHAPAEQDPRRAVRDDRAAVVLGVAGLVGFVLFLVGMVIRRPRKFGPYEHYGPFGETAIDLLVGTGGALVVGALVLGAAWAARAGLRDRGRRRRASAALRTPGAPSAPPPDTVVQELLGPWTARTAVALAWLAGTGLVGPSVLAGLTGTGPALVLDGVPWAGVALALGVGGLLATGLVVADVPRAARRRAEVRDRWHPGDTPGR